MDAIAYLKSQHQQFRKTLAQITKTTDKKLKLKKFHNFTEELVRHEEMEQKIWYPVLKKNKDLRDIISHLLSEEKSAAKVIKSFKKVEFGLIWRLKFMKFKLDVDHHANEEETELFPKVRKFLTKTELNKLSIKMKRYMNK